jgi:hypothetical protein
MALTAGRQNVLIAPEEAQEEVKRQVGAGRPSTSRPAGAGPGGLVWPACLRRLDREMPGYDA